MKMGVPSGALLITSTDYGCPDRSPIWPASRSAMQAPAMAAISHTHQILSGRDRREVSCAAPSLRSEPSPARATCSRGRTQRHQIRSQQASDRGVTKLLVSRCILIEQRGDLTRKLAAIANANWIRRTVRVTYFNFPIRQSGNHMPDWEVTRLYEYPCQSCICIELHASIESFVYDNWCCGTAIGYDGTPCTECAAVRCHSPRIAAASERDP